MAGTVKTYDCNKVLVTFGGVPITGFADGSFIKITPAADSFTKKVGADGEVARVRTNDNTHEVTLTLQATAASNLYLSGIHQLDKLSNSGVLPLSITDLSGATLFFWPSAWIRKNPDVEYAKEIGDRAWVLDTGQSAADVVGGAV